MEKYKSPAVFSPQDYTIVVKAVQQYYIDYGESLPEDEQRQIASLMHRLNRLNYDK